ncbi:tyrosine-type recombinase/integrase [Brevundimonas vesicularis]|uniref:tyrosine-type recombinase/integrase n=1 Tax=Brevundimonas vesicularis TaxID=41276 RepID=UPI0018EACC26|nr:integrase arm-type DNA-binding domain-containing protein [Brevundimonas vesicularis]
MPSEILTDRLISSLKPTSGRRLELSDAGCSGLALRASQRGIKVWILRYRGHDGRGARYRLGEYPQMSLRSARLEAGRLRSLISGGGDPLREKQDAIEAARKDAAATFGNLLGAYWLACETGEWQPKRKIKRASTLLYEKRLASRHIEPILSAVPVSTIKRATIKALLRDMVAKGIRAQTNRVQAIIRQVFNFAINEEIVDVNPAMGFPSLHAPRPRLKIWKDHELRSLWAALDGHHMLRTPDGVEIHVSRQVRIALQLAALLLQRRSEIVGMDIGELDFEQAIWIIPPERMKTNKPHQVPLPPVAIKLIKEAIALSRLPTDRQTGPVFPTPQDNTLPMKGEALTRAMDRIRDCIGVEDRTVHDLRRTGSTALTSERLGISPFIRSKVLGHGSDAGGGAQVSIAHYDANEYMSAKRFALTAWQTLLLHIVSAGEPDARKQQTGIIRGMVFGLDVANDRDQSYPHVSGA